MTCTLCGKDHPNGCPSAWKTPRGRPLWLPRNRPLPTGFSGDLWKKLRDPVTLPRDAIDFLQVIYDDPIAMDERTAMEPKDNRIYKLYSRKAVQRHSDAECREYFLELLRLERKWSPDESFEFRVGTQRKSLSDAESEINTDDGIKDYRGLELYWGGDLLDVMRVPPYQNPSYAVIIANVKLAKATTVVRLLLSAGKYEKKMRGFGIKLRQHRLFTSHPRRLEIWCPTTTLKDEIVSHLMRSYKLTWDEVFDDRDPYLSEPSGNPGLSYYDRSPVRGFFKDLFTGIKEAEDGEDFCYGFSIQHHPNRPEGYWSQIKLLDDPEEFQASAQKNGPLRKTFAEFVEDSPGGFVYIYVGDLDVKYRVYANVHPESVSEIVTHVLKETHGEGILDSLKTASPESLEKRADNMVIYVTDRDAAVRVEGLLHAKKDLLGTVVPPMTEKLHPGVGTSIGPEPGYVVTGLTQLKAGISRYVLDEEFDPYLRLRPSTLVTDDLDDHFEGDGPFTREIVLEGLENFGGSYSRFMRRFITEPQYEKSALVALVEEHWEDYVAELFEGGEYEKAFSMKVEEMKNQILVTDKWETCTPTRFSELESLGAHGYMAENPEELAHIAMGGQKSFGSIRSEVIAMALMNFLLNKPLLGDSFDLFCRFAAVGFKTYKQQIEGAVAQGKSGFKDHYAKKLEIDF